MRFTLRTWGAGCREGQLAKPLFALTHEESGGFPSGQRGQTVNLMATPSQVRILFPPPLRSPVLNLAGPPRERAPARLLTPHPSPNPANPPEAVTVRQSFLLASGQRTERGRSSMVERQPSKLSAWVRFPPPAPRAVTPKRTLLFLAAAPERVGAASVQHPGQPRSACARKGAGGCCSSVVEHFLGKEEVMGSSPISSSTSRRPRLLIEPNH